ncbi:hypothetical protein D9M68_860950 [compost metagenome]
MRASASGVSPPAISTRADSVARFTVASDTPACFFKAFSTRDTQEAQVMPPMPRSIWVGGREAVAVVIVFMGTA